MRSGEQFTCVECGYDEYWSKEDIVDEDGMINVPCYECKYCEQSVCFDCEEKHILNRCGADPAPGND